MRLPPIQRSRRSAYPERRAGPAARPTGRSSRRRGPSWWSAVGAAVAVEGGSGRGPGRCAPPLPRVGRSPHSAEAIGNAAPSPARRGGGGRAVPGGGAAGHRAAAPARSAGAGRADAHPPACPGGCGGRGTGRWYQSPAGRAGGGGGGAQSLGHRESGALGPRWRVWRRPEPHPAGRCGSEHGGPAADCPQCGAPAPPQAALHPHPPPARQLGRGLLARTPPRP
jgi:hypothetical protein